MIMEINATRYSDKFSFVIDGASYIGDPRPNTAMFVSKKIGRLIMALDRVDKCLVFAESGLDVSNDLLQKHCFVFSDHPQRDYARLTKELYELEEKKYANIEYHIEGGAIISKSATIGKGSIIEPGVVIGPGVVVGERAHIYAGVVIKNSIIGNDVIINEGSIVGGNGFTMAEDEHGDKIRIYSLGKVVIGNDVEIGANNNISRGSGGNTIIDDSVKMDALVHIGHDVHLHKNVEITAGVVVGGFVDVQEGAYIGINSVIRNRIELGAHCFIGMGATVTKSVDDGVTVIGNPAKPFIKK